MCLLSQNQENLDITVPNMQDDTFAFSNTSLNVNDAVEDHVGVKDDEGKQLIEFENHPHFQRMQNMFKEVRRKLLMFNVSFRTKQCTHACVPTYGVDKHLHI